MSRVKRLIHIIQRYCTVLITFRCPMLVFVP